MCSAQAHVRFTPESDIKRGMVKCPLWANGGNQRRRLFLLFPVPFGGLIMREVQLGPRSSMQAPGADDSRNNPAGPDDDVAIVIPTLNEATVMPRLLRVLGILTPAPAEVILVDGGSQDNTGALVRESGVARLIEHSVRGRAAAINRGVAEACAPLICVLHADTTLPDDAVAVIRATMRDSKTALAGFATIIVGAERVRWGTTFHNLIK